MTATDQQPAFVTADACRQWLLATPLSNAVQASALMLRQINLLNRCKIEAFERLAILELLRKRLLQAQEEGSKRFTGKPLPLVPPEHAAFDSAQALWQALLKGYGLCIEGEITQAANKEHLALVFQRAFATLAAAQIDIYRAGYEPSQEHWLALHKLYASAERSGVVTIAVDDSLRLGKLPSTPLATYIEILLLHLSSPHELSSRYFGWVMRWSRRWSRKARILTTPPALDGETTPLCVDLNVGVPASYHSPEGGNLRWIDASQLRRSLKKRLALLEQGVSPVELQLGNDCVQPACGKVLRQVYQRWCRGGVNRRHERRTRDAVCTLVGGVNAIYFQLADQRPFRQPGHADDESLRRERDELATFDRIAPLNVAKAAPVDNAHLEEWAVVEEWQLVDESATGLHAVHVVDGAVDRVNPRQLVAIKPPAAKNFLVGTLQWCMVTSDSRLHVGIFILPGRPEPVSIRPIEPSGVREPYKPGFFLPALAAVGAGPSVITAPGTFRAGRVLEIIGNTKQRVRLVHLLDRGIDFDRVSFEPLE